jgi:uncharacterized membrane protein YozB (DUF420 family)
LPTVNATLNSTSAALLITGFVFIRRKKVSAHKACMIGASIVSLLFLVSYTVYHNNVGFTRFTGEGVIRVIYFSILIPHTVLSIVALVPLALITLYLAARGKFEKHRKIACWTLPVWLFVSVSGVAIYFMLYHLV